MLLGFDIGNTSTTAGIYSDDNVIPVKTFQFGTEKNISPDELGKLVLERIKSLNKEDEKIIFDGFAFSSVAPEVNQSYREMAKNRFGVRAYEINYRSRLNITIDYDDPEQLGTDRIINAEATFNEYGGSNIIIDIGTAVTFCVLLENGIFDGGIIAPGIGAAIKSLSCSASQLPIVNFEKPDRIIAKDTINAIKSGFFYGWISLVDGIIEKIENEYEEKLNIILTGGFSKIISGHMKYNNTLDPLLSMKGIKYVYDLNK